ncbi:hypothetical protein GCM10018963_65470 [Saccharothrix longispora]
MLAALAVDAGQVVPVDRLIHRVWGGHPPQRARGHVATGRRRAKSPKCGQDRTAVVRHLRSGGCRDPDRR